MGAKSLSNPFIASFCKEIASVLHSGMPLSDGVLLILEYETNKETKALYQTLFSDLEKGVTLTKAIAKTNRFPDYMIQMVQIGEKTGRLDKVLTALSEYYEHQEQIGKSIKNAFVFPGVLLCVLLVVIITVMTQVMPVFEQVFEQMGIQMSAAAKTLTDLGRWISAAAPIFLIILSILFLSVLLVSICKPVKKRFFALFHNFRISKGIASARFAYVMAMTMASGMDVDHSLEMAQTVSENAILNNKIKECREKTKKGKSWASVIADAAIFSPVYNRMLALSFKTGNTDKVMMEIAEKTEAAANERIDSAISKIEPTIVVVMSVLVGLILLSVMLPLASVMTAVG